MTFASRCSPPDTLTDNVDKDFSEENTFHYSFVTSRLMAVRQYAKRLVCVCAGSLQSFVYFSKTRRDHVAIQWNRIVTAFSLPLRREVIKNEKKKKWYNPIIYVVIVGRRYIHDERKSRHNQHRPLDVQEEVQNVQKWHKNTLL